ncbi:MAG: preprotein translocase subunit SecE [Christensenellales bacterium]|jgi:preprotein translocase SecE subunit|nr:preprotein translocase subunit SecE [Clostridiales bacterium]
MAKKKDLIDIGEVEVKDDTASTKSRTQKSGPRKQTKQRVSTRGGRKVVIEKENPGKKIAAFFKGLKAELKLVTWPPWRSTQKVKGVWANTGVVLMVVLFFLIIITAFDAGLSALLRLLVGKAGS